jgi:hypothetical protein
MQNVDMLDIDELEQRRDNPGKAPAIEFTQGLTTEQKHLIDTIFSDKTKVFVSQIKDQFNNMHLELIRNFMH